MNKALKKIDKTDKIGGGNGGYFPRHLDNDFSVEDNIQDKTETEKDDAHPKVYKFWHDNNKVSIELKNKKGNDT
ncbi:hypothetical protein ACRBEF_13445 [Yersinia proxima]|uniref:hypothetical protein n=1 Tax=Yersinia proxima TaxID=2890316 RepID=UPI0011156F2D|nr:hypothetical protein [Yersinia proxima]